MRVRESKPSLGDVVGHYEDLDSLQVVSFMEATSVGEVLRIYLSKVGTWRQGSSELTRPSETLRPHRAFNELVNAFWAAAYPRLDGAPEWLREEFIAHWSEWLGAWQPLDMHDDEVAYVYAILKEALGVVPDPKDLP